MSFPFPFPSRHFTSLRTCSVGPVLIDCVSYRVDVYDGPIASGMNFSLPRLFSDRLYWGIGVGEPGVSVGNLLTVGVGT